MASILKIMLHSCVGLLMVIISVLPLIDFCVGANEETVDFDIKHLAEFGIVLSVGIFSLVIHF